MNKRFDEGKRDIVGEVPEALAEALEQVSSTPEERSYIRLAVRERGDLDDREIAALRSIYRRVDGMVP